MFWMNIIRINVHSYIVYVTCTIDVFFVRYRTVHKKLIKENKRDFGVLTYNEPKQMEIYFLILFEKFWIWNNVFNPKKKKKINFYSE